MQNEDLALKKARLAELRRINQLRESVINGSIQRQVIDGQEDVGASLVLGRRPVNDQV